VLYTAQAVTLITMKHIFRFHGQTNFNKPVQYPPGKTWQLKFKKHKRKTGVETGRKRIRKTGKEKTNQRSQGIRYKNNNIRDKPKYLLI